MSRNNQILHFILNEYKLRYESKILASKDVSSLEQTYEHGFGPLPIRCSMGHSTVLGQSEFDCLQNIVYSI